jgi:uncharacterized RDD family membrane protein YckC
VYCSKCGTALADGAAFCPNCGQAFSVVAATAPLPILSAPLAAPMAGGAAVVPAYAGYVAVPRVEYAGFWLRFLAYIIDSVVMGIGVMAVLIPLIFLTGLGGILSQMHPDEDMNDVSFFMLMGIIFLFATVSLVVTWLYHALMESSAWQATVGKRVLGLVVTDMAGQRVSFGRATARHFAKIVTNLIPLAIGYIMAGFTEKKQALHDMIARCLVLRRSS